jgi:hypothetical protein
MHAETTAEQKSDQEVMAPGEKTEAPCLKTESQTKAKTKAKTLNCRECAKKKGAVRKVAVMGGKAVVGLGAGVCLGVGVLSVAAIAEVALPVILTFKALGLTGGAIGLVKGAKEFNE